MCKNCQFVSLCICQKVRQVPHATNKKEKERPASNFKTCEAETGHNVIQNSNHTTA
eukprot:c33392_g1_i1 orf=2-166(-)